MKIGILGGSFDPLHNGHLTLARESEKQFNLDKILFIPSAIPPHKSKGGHFPIAPAPQRAHMIGLAILGEPKWELCDLELRRSGISYTIDTLRELRKIFPSPHELFFIAGADSFRDLQTWKDPDEIIKLSEWIVAPRPLVKVPSKLPPRFHFLNIPPLAISASEIRNKIGRGEDVSEWIPEKVVNYMKQMNLYGREG